jgi:hypothetical protein
MNILTKRALWRHVLLSLGMALICLGVVVGYFWLYRLAPLRRLMDGDWRKSHSLAAIWEEEQKDYRRTSSSPDVFFRADTIGHFGDKRWALWLIDNLRNDKTFRFCGCTDQVLRLMTNQRAGRNRDAWIRWFQEHREETQEQWLQEGFAEHGVMVHLPPSAEDHESLLILLGNRDKDADEKPRIPGELNYNAFRWLRDSGFHWADYMDSHPEWRSSKHLATGLCWYAALDSSYTKEQGCGLLAFASADSSQWPQFAITTLWANAIAYTAIFGGIGLGAILLAFYVRMRQTPKDSDGNSTSTQIVGETL